MNHGRPLVYTLGSHPTEATMLDRPRCPICQGPHAIRHPIECPNLARIGEDQHGRQVAQLKDGREVLLARLTKSPGHNGHDLLPKVSHRAGGA